MRRALKTGSLKEAVPRLFVDALGWEKGDGCLAQSGDSRVVETDSAPMLDEIGVRLCDRGRLELSRSDGGKVYRLRIDWNDPSESSLRLLESLKAELVVREGRSKSSSLESAFDLKSIATEFLSDYTALFEKHVVEIPIADEDERRSFFSRFLMRVLLLAFLQEKGWLSFKDGDDYLVDLYDDWKSDPGPHLFHQRLALVFFNALDEPREDARQMLRQQIGEVPYIGSGLFSPVLFEQEFPAVSKTATVPEELFEDLLGSDGLLRRYDFTASESGPNETIVAVSPEVLGAALSAFARGDESPFIEDTSSLRVKCRRVIASHLGVADSLGVPSDAQTRSEWTERLNDIHVFDDPCGAGSYLVAMLEELSGLIQAVATDSDRGRIKRDLLKNNLRGLDKNVMAVQVARLRLALAALSNDTGDSPEPLPDIRQVVKKGGALNQNKKTRLVEDEKTEFKSTFEWDSRRGSRNPELRFATLKTVAAFLNSAGGDLYIGLDDSGNPIGIANDLALLKDDRPEDVFENRLREFLKNHLDPMPLSNVSMRFVKMSDYTVCVVTVRAANGINYLSYKDQEGKSQEGVFVRDGNRTVELKGRARDQFVVDRKE